MYSRNNIFGSSNQRKEVQRRTWTIMIIFMLLFCFLIWKIINYMYFKAEPLKTMFNAQYTIDEKYGLQYSLTDCNDIPLLDYAVNYYAIINPMDFLTFKEYTSKYDLEALTIILRNYNKNYDLEKIKDNSNSQKVKYKIDEDTYDKLKDIKGVKGFYAYAANELIKDRYWKIENILTNLTYNKVVAMDSIYKDYYKKDVTESVDQEYYKKVVTHPVSQTVLKSDDSLEMQIYNKTKNNEFTKIRFVKGFDGEISEGKIIEPENNVNVRLTLNQEIQDNIEKILHQEKYEKYKQIGIVLMESRTGKIRAMAQKDDNIYNANLGIPGTNGAYPGSIFKTIVSEAGLDLNLIDKNEIFTVDGSKFKKPDKQEKGYKYTLAEAFYNSSNDIFAQIGERVELENMYGYAEKQGILDKVLNLHYEQSVKVDLSTKDGNISNSVIGQKVKITPLQAISIPNTIINKGIYVQPSIIDAYVNDNNENLEEITSKTSRVLKSKTAETMKHFMMDVVTKGTGHQAYIAGMDIGGKTGTTEYYKKGIKYSDGWFVGFFSLNKETYSMVVFVSEIDVNAEEGGNTAAPIFKEIINTIKEID